ncbi:UNVERIFIED_CONTAM: hypothetical protein PYX00_002110 [Menopon gallinae]|uniref:G-protein coupled receptors family 1 profile domain-containing protein n=1 Tax=Menopon gallinae TaxID=328185 RepID=A0AAW2IFM9_9NEOP
MELFISSEISEFFLLFFPAYRPMRRVTNFLLVNLSIADLLMAVINCLFNFVYMLHRDWWFGDTYCVANNFMATLTVSASVFTLTGITVDRYLAIVKPLQPRMSKAAAELIIGLIWTCAIILAFPSLLYSTTITEPYKGKNRTACILVWPDGRPTESHMDRIYNVVILLATYIIPMTVMIICYTAMSRELRRSKAIGEMTRAQQDSINSKRKIVRLFVFIVATFGICWLPYHGYFIYTNYYTSVLHSKFIQHVYLAFYWLAMCNAMVNPFIYYWINNR